MGNPIKFWFVPVGIIIQISLVLSLNCAVSGPCYCELEDGTGYDLKPLEKKDYFIATSVDFSYYFHPCSDTDKAPDNVVNNTCTKYSLCGVNRVDKLTTILGTADSTSFRFSANATDPGVYLVVMNNLNKTITIQLACTNGPDVFATMNNDETNIQLILNSKLACLKKLTHKSFMSLGTKLDIILFTIVFSYISLGIVVNFFLLGARGVEVLPHLDFWRDFPSLVKDGAVFLHNGCRAAPTSLYQNSADSYDAI